MAEATPEAQVCHFYREGDCRFGDSCRFKHERNLAVLPETTTTPARSSEPCRYFILGSCAYGDQCKFSHAPSIDPKWVDVPDFVPKGGGGGDNLDFYGEASGGGSSDVFFPEDVPVEDIESDPEEPGSSDDTFGLQALSKLFLSKAKNNPLSVFTSYSPLCPYAEASIICKKANCPYLHGDLCDMCNRPVLHPLNEELRKKHQHDCLQEYEENMKHSFAVAKSLEEVCGICYEKVLEKPRGKSRFGILPKCLHCFCLECIRNWRQKDGYEKETSRSCPICRVVSDYVIPSEYWMDTVEEKVKLMEDYKNSMSTIHCKFFKRGKGSCPFNNSCFYLHAMPDGKTADEVRKIKNADGVEVMVEQTSLWDFVAERNQL